MNPLRYIKALFGLGDVDAFWMAREEILKRPGKHCLENYLCKIIRKHYGAGIHHMASMGFLFRREQRWVMAARFISR